jgi:hypothetical protein
MLVELAFSQNANTRNYLMKNILLATTAIVAFAGAAAAEGHTSITWSGTVTAGVARQGGTDATDGGGIAMLQSLINDFDSPTPYTDAGLEAALVSYLSSISSATTAADAADAIRADIVLDLVDLEVALNTGSVTPTEYADGIKKIAALSSTLDAIFGKNAVATGDVDTYAEINATVTGTVVTDLGITLSASMSVDAGTGYDFADDDGFDAAKTNGVGFDNAVLDAGAYGVLTFAPNDLAQLVDDDDDASADIKYVNTFGPATFTMVADIDKDTDPTAAAASWGFADGTATQPANAVSFYNRGTDDFTALALEAGGTATADDYLTYSPAVAADVQWSAKIETSIGAAGSVYAAFDEGEGNAIGGSYTIEGITFSASSKLEALEAAEGTDRSNTIGASYVMGAMSVGASWNSIDDGNQWSINGAYAAGPISFAASTNEGEEWEITTAYALGDNASVKAGVNYTEDAFVGVAFNF